MIYYSELDLEGPIVSTQTSNKYINHYNFFNVTNRKA